MIHDHELQIWDIFFGGRYIILPMGIFSIYSGLLYNDVFSLSFNIFGSGWHSKYNMSTLMSNPKLTLSAAEEGVYTGPYYMGLDSAWQVGRLTTLSKFESSLGSKLVVTASHPGRAPCYRRPRTKSFS